MLGFKAVILLSSAFYENVLSLIDAADASFLSLSNRLNNIESELEAKKKEFWDILVDKLAGSGEASPEQVQGCSGAANCGHSGVHRLLRCKH